MADMKRLSTSADGIQTWESFVDGQLEHIWSEASELREDADIDVLTDVVLLRMLEWTDSEHAFRDLGQMLDTIVDSVVHEEGERARRRMAWRQNRRHPPSGFGEPSPEGPP
jgi:hypothetical protein